MNQPQLDYLGPVPDRALSKSGPSVVWWKRLPWPFLAVVVLPTLLAVLYFGLIASPRYVSESRFIVRSSGQAQPSSLGIALEGVGLSTTQSDAFSVHEYMKSRDAFADLRRRYNLSEMLGPRGVDAFSKYPRPWEGRSDEAFYKAFQRFIVVGYDSSTGISTLRVQAFSARDAQRMSDALLLGGEALVNRLNDRAASDAVEEAEDARSRARERLSESQRQLTEFRNQEEFIDPTLTAQEGSALIGGLLSTAAQLRAERSQMAALAPDSPQLPILDAQIRAYEGQIATERAKIAGNAGSLAPKVGIYQDLQLNRELADRELTAATAALTNAEQDVRRQKLYLDRIVAPSLPDSPGQPRRFIAILTVLLSSLLVYGLGWFVWAGAREHGQNDG